MQGNNKKQKPPGEFKLSDPHTPIAGNRYPDQKQVVYDEAVRRLENEVYTFKMLKDGRPAQRPAGISLSMPIRLQENLDPPSQTSSITESTAGRREIPRQKASPNEKRVVWTGELERVSKVNSPGRTEDDNISVVSKASQIASTVGRVAGAVSYKPEIHPVQERLLINIFLKIEFVDFVKSLPTSFLLEQRPDLSMTTKKKKNNLKGRFLRTRQDSAGISTIQLKFLLHFYHLKLSTIYHSVNLKAPQNPTQKN